MPTEVQTFIFGKLKEKLYKRLYEDWGSPIGGDLHTKDNENEEDVPNIADTKDYKTHFSLEMELIDELREQDEEEKNPEDVPPDENAPSEEDVPPDENAPPEGEVPPDQQGMVDPNDPTGGMGGAAGGMPGMDAMGQPVKDPKILGRTYELKKIYARLVSIESYLSSTTDVSLIQLKNYVTKAIELFETLSDNIQSFNDKVDDIIIMFYKFLRGVYSILEKYYKEEEKKEKTKNK